MKATGIVRRIDDLGRIVIPKEIRRTMRIREGDPLEIYTSPEGEVIFKKYSPVGEISSAASQYADVLSKVGGCPAVICDRDHVIAVSGMSKKEIIEHTEYKRKGDSANDDVFFAQFIHRDCKEGDGCSYTEEDSSRTCAACDGKLKTVTCDVHGTVDTYCPNCQPNRMNNVGKCSNRIGKKEIDSYLMSHGSIKDKMMGDDGKTIYPNVNIFLVSCDENADIRLSSRAASKNTEDPEVFIQNGFFGYVYAPYVTFKAGPSNSGGGMVRFLGGLTVSDYIIDDSYTMLSCWPDKLPEDLMGEESFKNKLPGIGTKSWKIDLKAH